MTVTAAPMKKPLDWQRIEETYDGVPEGQSKRRDKGCTYRAKVPGGWLVAIWAGSDKNHAFGGGLTFVPDPDHAAWKDLATTQGNARSALSSRHAGALGMPERARAPRAGSVVAGQRRPAGANGLNALSKRRDHGSSAARPLSTRTTTARTAKAREARRSR